MCLIREKNQKILSILGAAGLVATSSATVVACGPTPTDNGNGNDKDDDYKATSLAELFTRSTNIGPLDADELNYLNFNDPEDIVPKLFQLLVTLNSKDGPSESKMYKQLKNDYDTAAKAVQKPEWYTNASDALSVIQKGRNNKIDNFVLCFPTEFDNGTYKIPAGDSIKVSFSVDLTNNDNESL